jgi:hypothetical protein
MRGPRVDRDPGIGLVALRRLLWHGGLEGWEPTALFSSIIEGGAFVMCLVVAGTLSDDREQCGRRATWPAGCTRSCLRPSS